MTIPRVRWHHYCSFLASILYFSYSLDIQAAEPRSFAELSAMWKDTVAREGFLEIKGSEAQIAIPGKFLELVTSRKNPVFARPVQCDLPSEFIFKGYVSEFDERETRVYSSEHGLALLTVWHVVPPQEIQLPPSAFLNANVKSTPATLSLLWTDRSRRILWKLSWFVRDISYEVYLEDVSVPADLPLHYSPHRVNEIAENLSCR